MHPLSTGLCTMDKGHNGRHTTVSFWCDVCGKMRRGSPAYVDVDADEYGKAQACWMCHGLPRQRDLWGWPP